MSPPLAKEKKWESVKWDKAKVKRKEKKKSRKNKITSRMKRVK